MKIRVAELPGIGKKIAFLTASGSKIVLVVHHTGKRDMYFFEDGEDDEPDFHVELTADETREFGAQLLGATYQPVDVERMRLFRNQMVIEWVPLHTTSVFANKTLIDSQIREKTGVTIVGIERNGELIGSPNSHTVLLPGDVLMAIGKSEQIEEFTKLCSGEGA